jgi:hypothetical protein
MSASWAAVPDGEDESAQAGGNIVLNWFDELKRLAPTGK